MTDLPTDTEGPASECRALPGNLPKVTLNVDASNVKVVLDPPSLRPKPATKEKRGRPPTHGEYVEFAEAKKAMLELSKFKVENEADNSIAQAAGERRSKRQACEVLEGEDSSNECGGKSAEDLVCQLQETALVEKVTLKSKRLKGTSVKAFKEAACPCVSFLTTWAK